MWQILQGTRARDDAHESMKLVDRAAALRLLVVAILAATVLQHAEAVAQLLQML